MKPIFPLVSVVMAAYNAENTIRDAIDSIVNQTYQNFEFIIINDGSTDKTEEIILSFKDDRIVYIKNEVNLKLIASLNKGLAIAKGKYIARMDADDISKKNRLEEQVDFMEKNPEIGICGCQLELFGDHNGFMNYAIGDEDIRLNLLITSTFGNNAVIFRSDIFRNNKLFFPEGYIHAEDYKLWTKWSRYTKMANLNIVLVKYRSHSESVSNKFRNIQRETRNKIRKEYLKELLYEMDDNCVNNFFDSFLFSRIEATKKAMTINKSNSVFNEDEFTLIIYKLWFSDCIEKAEESFLPILHYPFFLIPLKKYYLNDHLSIIKHYIKNKIV